ncbi:MAG: serine hydrolase [Candidatus Saccharimonadales bacterium]
MARRRMSLKKYWAIILLAFVLAITAYIYWPDNGLNNNGTVNGPSTSNIQENKPQPNLPVIDLQPTVDAWADAQNGRASIVIYDLANKMTVASLNPDRQYFTASIYKLYVAYIGYQKIADGTYNASEPYLSGYTRMECLGAMIRDSYSPCGEKWWNELGKQALTDKMKNYGLKNTSLTGLYTSAADAAIILQRLFERQDLTKLHRAAFLDSMEEQPALYRRGLPSGFSKSTVYNKVGWNLQVEWHDTAIVTLPNGRSYVVTILTQNIGSAQIATLGKAIEARLTQ